MDWEKMMRLDKIKRLEEENDGAEASPGNSGED